MTSTQGSTRRGGILKRIEEIDQEIKDIQNAEVESSTELWNNRLEVIELENEWIDLDDELRALDGDG